MTVISERYESGDYLERTGGTWHLEDAPFKTAQVLKMIERHNLFPKTVCEVGCGAGGILANLQQHMRNVQFTGYEISPQAHGMSLGFGNEKLKFVLGDALVSAETSDLVLVMDVIEHVEDVFGFLRKLRPLGRQIILHIPLDISASAAVRDSFMNAWDSVGHIHVFSRSLALATLRTTGYEVIDHFYTPGALAIGRGMRATIANLPRRILPEHIAARLLGGYSLMVLATPSNT